MSMAARAPTGQRPVVVAVLALARGLAAFESRLARGPVGAKLSYGPPASGDLTVVECAKRLTLDPRRYLAIGYLLSRLVVGIAAFAMLIASPSISAAFAAAPVVYDCPGVGYEIGA